MIRIIVIDEQQSTCKKTCDVLSAYEDFNIVGVGKDAYSALDLVWSQPYDVIIFDWFSQHTELENGYLIHILSRHNPKALMLLTEYEDEAHIRKALETNIQCYLLKKSDLSILPDLTRKIPKDNVWYINHSIALKATAMFSKVLQEKYILTNFTPLPQTVKSFTALPRLSKHELQTLLFVFKGYNYKEIAENLNLCEGTIRNYYYTSTKKTGIRNRRELAAFISRCGLDEYAPDPSDKTVD
ncbi:MAG: response regulator transcription factor [Spirochaetaceae bacterium]|jgi:DNA-binding NarL/FixJ family response regulator|nr:response regulator transcription factor [Spirochaetaceae bacterium]